MLYQIWYIGGDFIIKSSTYSSIATILFIKNKSKICKSIDSAIRATDDYCERLGLINNLSHMTKYRVINELIKSNIFSQHKEKSSKKLKLSNDVYYFLDSKLK